MLTEILKIGFILFIGSGLTYLKLSPRIKQTQFIDKSIEEKNEKLKQQVDALTGIYDRRKTEIEKSCEQYYTQMMEIQKKKIDYDLKVLQDGFNNAVEESRRQLDEEQLKIKSEFESLQNKLDALRSKTSAAIEANKRIASIKEKENYYKLNIPDQDIKEIIELRKCLGQIRKPETLNKAIWKCYYEKPYSDLIGRVVGSKIKTGIYKITNLQDGKCYVGQAVNIAERWKQHIKRGIGADTPTQNKLYPAMMSIGIENFSFEIVEECDRQDLNEREDYWQEYFGAKEFGYSIK